MKCPECGSTKSGVIDTRSDGEFTYRYRCCKDCHHRYYTVETIVESSKGFNEARNLAIKKSKKLKVKAVSDTSDNT